MKTTVANLIRNYSFEQVERMLYSGQIGQLTFEAYCRVWDWIAPRFGGTIGWKQECLFKRSKELYFAKINKTRQAFGYAPYSLS